MFAHIILASASTASSKMSAKHQENDTSKSQPPFTCDCGVSSSGSRTLSVGGAPQAREVCVVPQEQCGVVTLCDLPTAEGQGSPLPKTAGCLCPRLLAYGQPQYQSAPLATAGDCKVYRLLQGKWNGMLVVSRLRPRQQQFAAYFVSLAETEGEIPLPP